jgi:hypothetical protein
MMNQKNDVAGSGSVCFSPAKGSHTPMLQQSKKPMPNQNHPLTRAYMLGARATTPAAMTDAMRLIRACELGVDQLTIDQCKLAAEVLIERKMP